MTTYAEEVVGKGEHFCIAGGNASWCYPFGFICMAISQKIRKQPSSRSSNTIFGYISKGCSIVLKGHVLNYVHSSIVCHSQTWKQPKCTLTDKWIRKIWYNCKLEYYTAEKNNDILKFSGKWMDLENIILNEVT